MEWLSGLSEAERFTALVAFFSALLGGSISLITTLISGSVSNRYNRSAQAQEQKKTGALNAYVAFQRLLNTANTSLNLTLHFEKAFKEAEQLGMVDAQPWQKIKTLVGHRHPVQFLDVSATLFLIDTKKTDLISEILLLQQRVQNNETMIEVYNLHRKELVNFLETKLLSTGKKASSAGGFELDGNEALMGNARGQALNDLLVGLLDDLEQDSLEAKRVTNEFCNAATSYFGDSFPKVNVKWSN